MDKYKLNQLTYLIQAQSTLNSTDVDLLVNQIVFEEPVISESRKPQLKKLILSIVSRTNGKADLKKELEILVIQSVVNTQAATH